MDAVGFIVFGDCLGIGLVVLIIYMYRRHINNVKQKEQDDKDKWNKGG